MSEVCVRVITDRTEGTPGAVRFGPSSDPERYRYGNYERFWWEVGHLADHRAMLAQYQAEAADSPPSQVEARTRRAEEHTAFVETLAVAASVAAQKFDALADLGVVIEFFGAPGRYTPAAEHRAARSA